VAETCSKIVLAVAGVLVAWLVFYEREPDGSSS